MPQTHLLLDFDNTQMGTEKLALPSLIQRFNDLYGSQTDHPLTLKEFKDHFHGQARETLCANLSKHFGITVDFKELYKDRERYVARHYKEVGVEMAPHLIAALQKQSDAGIGLALVSNNPIQRAFAAMLAAENGQGERLAHFFGPRCFEAGDIQKPNPAVYLHAMQQLGITPQECWAVEDSITGVKAAVAAGIPVFGFTGFSDDRESAKKELIKAGAIACFHDWNEFDPLFNAFRHQRSVQKGPAKVLG